MVKKLKKIAKKIFSLLPSSYIVIFHHVTGSPHNQRSGCVLDLDSFKTFLLRYKGCYVALNDAVKKKTKHKIAITFDDGLEDVYTVAYPLLKEANIPFTIFVVTNFLDQEGYITTAQLLEMSRDPLVTIGSHGTTHAVFPKLTREEKMLELGASKSCLETILQRPIDFFAYSHGQYDKETLKCIKDYKFAFTVRGIPLNKMSFNRYALPRFNVDAQSFQGLLSYFNNELNKGRLRARS